MKVTLERMGMDFLNNDNKSDVGNHRVRTEFVDKNGIHVVVDFSGFDRRKVQQTNTGKNKIVIAQKNALCVDGTYRDNDGTGRNYAYRLWENGFDFTKYNYTISGILAFLSDVTGNDYNEVEFIACDISKYLRRK